MVCGLRFPMTGNLFPAMEGRAILIERARSSFQLKAEEQRTRRRLWLADGSCLRLRPERANHVSSYDFVSAFTRDGRAICMLDLIDEYAWECLPIRPHRD
jgi:hypothetical protein